MEFRTPLAGLISIHAPRMGSDKSPRRNSDSFYAFQSTLPGWGATHYSDYRNRVVHISIHAPRMGSDITPIQWRKMTFISIHAPRMGSDPHC